MNQSGQVRTERERKGKRVKTWCSGWLALPVALALCLALAAPARATELAAGEAEAPVAAAAELPEQQEELLMSADDAAQEEASSAEENGSDPDEDTDREEPSDGEEKTNEAKDEAKTGQKEQKEQGTGSSGKQSKSDQSDEPDEPSEPESVFPPAGADGVCGEKLSWTLKNHVLTISGSGAMYDYVGSKDGSSGELPPWSSLLGENEVGIQSVVVEEGVTTIGDFAFFLELDLAEVSLPSTLKSIGTSAFGWSGLSSLTLPEGLTSIGEGAFLLCSSLREAALPDSVREIGADAFSCCDELTSVTLGESLKTIGKGAFEDCPKLKTVAVPKGVTTIGERAFGYYTDDTSEDFKTAQVEGFSLSGAKDSAACTYARENGFLFRAGGKLLWPLDTPVLTSVTAAANGMTVRWEKVPGAVRYRVYCRAAGSRWQAVGETTGTSYLDRTASAGSGCVYTVRCINGKAGSCVSNYDHTGLSAQGAEQLALRISTTEEGIRLRWNAVSGADSYQIYRNTGGGYQLMTAVKGSGYVDSYTKTEGRSYSYRVYACSAAGKTLCASPARSVCWKGGSDDRS